VTHSTGSAAAAAEPAFGHVRLTHIGGPTVLIEVDGWRLLTDPTFDPPGMRYSFGWGAFSWKTDARRSPRQTSAASTRSCCPTVTMPTTRPGTS